MNPSDPVNISAKRTAVNSAIVIWLVGLVNTITGWQIKLNDVGVLYVGLALGAIMGVGYRVSRYLTAKWPILGYFLFGSGQEPVGMQEIKKG